MFHYQGFLFISKYSPVRGPLSQLCLCSSHLQVLEVQVGLVLVSWLVATVTVGDDGVQQILEDFVGLLITGDTADGHDEGVTWRKERGTTPGLSSSSIAAGQILGTDCASSGEDVIVHMCLTRVVNTSLDDVIHGETTGGGFAPQLTIDLLGQHLVHKRHHAGQ